MRQHHAFRLPRGAGGVEQAPEILGIAALGSPGFGRGAVGEAEVAGKGRLVEGNPVVERDEAGESPHGLGVLGAIEQTRDLSVLQNGGQLARREAGAERHQDHPRLGRGEEGVDVLDPVVGEDGEAVALAGAQSAPDPGEADGPGVELAVGEALARGDVDQRGPVRREARPFAEEIAGDQHLQVPSTRPPSTESTVPVMKPAASEASQR